MDQKYHTLNEGIPARPTLSHIGMDTNNHREGLHLWISHHDDDEDDAPLLSLSVHLTRKEAMNLIEEINHRLF